MNKARNHIQPWRVLWLIPVAVLAALSIVATGGGSGGGGGDGPDDVEAPLVILPNYNFFLANLNNGAPLTVDVGGEFTVTVDIDGLFAGNLDLDVAADTSVTFLSYLLRAGNSFVLTVTSTEGSDLDGTLLVSVMTDVEGAVGEPPTSGLIWLAPPDVLEFSVTILADGVAIYVGRIRGPARRRAGGGLSAPGSTCRRRDRVPRRAILQRRRCSR
jgi:hypothetical protein